MTSVTFRIHYVTKWGENLFIEGLVPAQDSDGERRQTWPMRHDGEGFWLLRLDTVEPGSVFEYRYEFRDREGDVQREPVLRRIEVAGNEQVVWDHWLAPSLPDCAFLRQAFAGVIFNPSRAAVAQAQGSGRRRFRLTIRAPRVMAGHRLCVSGGHPLLGDWEPARARVMSGSHYPLWELDLPAEEFSRPTEFKFGLWDESLERLVQFEEGANRRFDGAPPNPDVLVVNFEQYRHIGLWRGAGVAVPVFSLRSQHGYGIGEFADLSPFAEWAAGCGLHLVQLLPVNDTSSDFTWKDSYPYKAISTAALHPIYLNIEQVFKECGAPLPKGYAKRRNELNLLPQVDYEAVLKEKLAFLRRLFGRIGKAAQTRDFKKYLREQSHWLVPYAAFCRLRDLHGTADFSQWGEHAVYPAKQVKAWFKAGSPEHDEVTFHCWVQFHLDQQLSEALAAGHARGVAFKGDLPIGIDRSSVEAWTEPELFRMDRQTGAPPDAFAELGQNWGFPTYNWPRMEADGYAWWRRRFHRMSAAFDAIRVDHILGFFRIWEIPRQYREGIMGHYNPTLPLTREEIRRAGFMRDPGQFVSGAVAEAMLLEFFGEASVKVRGHLLARDEEGFYRLRPEFVDAQARQAWYTTSCTEPEAKGIEDGVTRLGLEVLFLEDPDQLDRFHPRISLTDTAIYRSLPPSERTALRLLHDDFYFQRHTRFWQDEAMKKLPVLMDASPMLICGEDLGMVPDSVPVVLKRLGLLSLEVQRMPKRMGHRLGNPADYPYLSVCTTSTHDMSTIRGWWEEEAEIRQHFWTEVMGRDGTAPSECSTQICRFIVKQNLASASMWCILPLQDWLGVDPQLRHPVAAQERINVPAIPRHYWRYRMHLTVEAMLEAEEFNRSVAELVEASGRNQRD